MTMAEKEVRSPFVRTFEELKAMQNALGSTQKSGRRSRRSEPLRIL